MEFERTSVPGFPTPLPRVHLMEGRREFDGMQAAVLSGEGMQEQVIPEWLADAQERRRHQVSVPPVEEKGIDAEWLARRLAGIAVVIVAHAVTETSIAEPAEALHFPFREPQLDIRIDEQHRQVEYRNCGSRPHLLRRQQQSLCFYRAYRDANADTDRNPSSSGEPYGYRRRKPPPGSQELAGDRL